METLEVVNAEYTTNHHLGFSGVLETSDSLVDAESFETKALRSSAVDKEKFSNQDAFQLELPHNLLLLISELKLIHQILIR